jgi:hypothetical protein
MLFWPLWDPWGPLTSQTPTPRIQEVAPDLGHGAGLGSPVSLVTVQSPSAALDE